MIASERRVNLSGSCDTDVRHRTKVRIAIQRRFARRGFGRDLLGSGAFRPAQLREEAAAFKHSIAGAIADASGTEPQPGSCACASRSHRGRAARACLTVVSADANVWLFSATTLHFRQYCAHAIDETGETHAATLGRHAC